MRALLFAKRCTKEVVRDPSILWISLSTRFAWTTLYYKCQHSRRSQ